MSASWYQWKEDGRRLILNLYIQPNASRTEVAELHDGALKIKVAAPPTDHQANHKLLDFLCKSYRVGRKQITLKHGEHARRKIVEIVDPDAPADILTRNAA